MDDMRGFYRGCLLGLAVGDAMGYAVDQKTWDEIRSDYGPNGLLGYDLVNDRACITACTQLTAYTCNGLLLALSRGKWDSLTGYVKLALKEWARGQAFPRDPEKSFCWVAKLPYMRRKACRDPRMLDAIRLDMPGTLEHPKGSNNYPGSLPEAIAVGMVNDPEHLPRERMGRLTADLMVATHGDLETVLSGVVLTYIISGILREPDTALETRFRQAIQQMREEYGSRFSQADKVAETLEKAIVMAWEDAPAIGVMESFVCGTACQCLAGALYASLVGREDFDTAMIVSVNHSGRSSTVGAITGAILGATMGDDVLPDFYLDCLEPAPVLRELAGDMYVGTPAASLFDDDWDQKYTQGLPVG